jgi:hypothetical protein
MKATHARGRGHLNRGVVDAVLDFGFMTTERGNLQSGASGKVKRRRNSVLSFSACTGSYQGSFPQLSIVFCKFLQSFVKNFEISKLISSTRCRHFVKNYNFCRNLLSANSKLCVQTTTLCHGRRRRWPTPDWPCM